MGYNWDQQDLVESTILQVAVPANKHRTFEHHDVAYQRLKQCRENQTPNTR